MKHLKWFAACLVLVSLLASCNKDKNTYMSFVGTWGVEKIDYYNIDYAGNPISASLESYSFDPDDPDNTIQIVFRENKTGEMRDGAIDTVWLYNEETQAYDSYIYRPDTVMVYTFTYSYDERESELYMTVKYTYPYEYLRTFMMKISELKENSFIYENEYDIDYVEKTYLKRVSNTPSKSAGQQTAKHPYKRGALLGDR